MRSGRSTRTFLRVLALFGALAAAGPADAAWSGDCAPTSAEPLLAQIGDAVDQGLAKAPHTIASLYREKKITAGTRLDVPFLTQSGSTCGFYAASMVLADYRGASVREGNAQAVSMFESAKNAKYTTDGFISIENLSKTIRRETHHDTRLKAGATVDDLQKAIEKGRPPIVLFVVEKDPKSSNYGGPAAVEPAGKNLGHYAVIEGIVTDDQGKRYIIAQHGWRAEPYVWPEEEFTKSWGVRGSAMLEIRRTREENGLEARK